MSAKTTALVMTAMASTCGSDSDPAPAAASYSCAHAFDTGCRYDADVTLTGGTLSDAAITPLPGFGAASVGTFDSLTGTVTVTDRLSNHASVTCDFSIDMDFASETTNGRALVDVSTDVVFDAACPLTCAWFMPGSGDYAADAGQFRLSMFEGQWELQFGASTPDEPEYGPLWMWTGTSDVTFGEGVALNAPTAMGGGEWSVPMGAPSGSAIDPVCP